MCKKIINKQNELVEYLTENTDYNDVVANEIYLKNLSVYKSIQTLSEREKDIVKKESKFTFGKLIQLLFFIMILINATT
jgi:hypothetical protein